MCVSALSLSRTAAACDVINIHFPPQVSVLCLSEKRGQMCVFRMRRSSTLSSHMSLWDVSVKIRAEMCFAVRNRACVVSDDGCVSLVAGVRAVARTRAAAPAARRPDGAAYRPIDGSGRSARGRACKTGEGGSLDSLSRSHDSRGDCVHTARGAISV